MLPLIALIMAAAQAASESEKEGRSAQLASQTTRYSPWSGQKTPAISYANPVGTLSQGVGSALALGQNEKSASQQEAMQQAMLKLMGAQTKYYGGAGDASAAPAGLAGGYGMPNGSDVQSPWLKTD